MLPRSTNIAVACTGREGCRIDDEPMCGIITYCYSSYKGKNVRRPTHAHTHNTASCIFTGECNLVRPERVSLAGEAYSLTHTLRGEGTDPPNLHICLLVACRIFTTNLTGDSIALAEAGGGVRGATRAPAKRAYPKQMSLRRI